MSDMNSVQGPPPGICSHLLSWVTPSSLFNNQSTSTTEIEKPQHARLSYHAETDNLVFILFQATFQHRCCSVRLSTVPVYSGRKSVGSQGACLLYNIVHFRFKYIGKYMQSIFKRCV